MNKVTKLIVRLEKVSYTVFFVFAIIACLFENDFSWIGFGSIIIAIVFGLLGIAAIYIKSKNNID